MKATTVFSWNWESDADVIINQGGTSSGKTYAILQVLFLRAIEDSNLVITVAGQDMPNLRVGAIRDAKTIALDEQISVHLKGYNSTEKVFSFKNGSIIEFKSYDDWQDAKSGKRDYLFVNEANGIPFEVYNELQVRTRKQVFIDYNPNAAFWVHDLLIPMIGNPESTIKVVRFISNYTHNDFLDETTIKRIEALKTDKSLWRVYGLGFTGKVRGLIFRKWEQVFSFPNDGNNIAFGLDFGFSESKCAVVQCCEYDQCLYAKEYVYELDLSNKDLAAKLLKIVPKGMPIYADSAEPKSIADLRSYGLNVIGIKKTADDTEFSIMKVNEYREFRVFGLNIYKEVSTYAFKNGKLPNKNDHLMDAVRYYTLGVNGRVSNKFTIL